MCSKTSNIKLAEFIKSEMLDNIVFRNDLGEESKVTYKDFFLRLRKRKTLASHLELVSCVTLIDEFYPVVYDCFVEDYGYVDFETHPKSLKKFSPVLFTLCLDFIANKGIIINREYSKPGKDIAYLEKLLHSEIHYTKLESTKVESAYYKDFLAELINSGDGINSVLGVLMLEAELLIGETAKVEISEIVMLIFYKVFDGIVSPPNQVDKTLNPTNVNDLQFMLSSIGVYTCVNHIKKDEDLKILLPKLYIVKANPKDKH